MSSPYGKEAKHSMLCDVSLLQTMLFFTHVTHMRKRNECYAYGQYGKRFYNKMM